MALPRVLPSLLLASLCACGGPGEKAHDAGPDAGPEFVALQGDFADFQSWESFDGGADGEDGLDGGVRTVYLNRRPPAGSTSFPLGTILVKTTERAETFAMAKRGGRFNPSAFNWEWFELTTNGDGGVLIKWRGKGPDSTPGYGTEAPTGCTGCHMLAFRNDFVAGPVRLNP